jgi:hypothetical protein
MLMYIDQLDRIFDFQAAVTKNERDSAQLFAKFDKTPGTSSQFAENMIKRAARLLKLMRPRLPPSANLALVTAAMALVAEDSDEQIKRAIAKSKAPSAFSFALFLRTYVTDPRILKIIMNRQEYLSVKKFLSVVEGLRK